MKKLVVLVFMIFFLFSCSNDSNSNSNENTQITGYEVRSKSVYQDPSIPTLETVKIGNLQNGKLFSETIESFSNGISQGYPVTTQTHFYNADLLISQIDRDSDRVREYYYDSNNRMIAAKMTLNSKSFNYYRFIYISDNTLYFERTTAPYDDPTAVIQFRNIIEFDESDNIISAGRDTNLDGVIENLNLFSYLNNNLVSITSTNGSVQNFDYSNVIDNFSVLGDKSYGKRNLRIINSEIYVNLNTTAEFQSANVLSQDVLDNVYDVLSTNFYKKKTVVKNYSEPQLQNTTTTEFFFN